MKKMDQGNTLPIIISICLIIILNLDFFNFEYVNLTAFFHEDLFFIRIGTVALITDAYTMKRILISYRHDEYHWFMLRWALIAAVKGLTQRYP